MQTITRNLIFVQNCNPDPSNKFHSLLFGLYYFYKFLAQIAHNMLRKLIEVKHFKAFQSRFQYQFAYYIHNVRVQIFNK
jgi:hypothetical protein